MPNFSSDGESPKEPGDSRRGFRLRFRPSEVQHLPHITIDGQKFHIDRAGLVHLGRCWAIMEPPRSIEIQLARRWFDDAVRIQTPNWGSYALKHCVEIACRRYISNGSAIVAAHRAGFSIRNERFGPSMNCVIGVQTKWLRQRPESRILGLWKAPQVACFDELVPA